MSEPSIRVREGRVLVLIDAFQMKTRSGIMLPTMKNRMGRPCKGQVIGGAVETVNPGDRIAWEMGSELPPEGTDDVVGLLDPEHIIVSYPMEGFQMTDEEKLAQYGDSPHHHIAESGAVLRAFPGRMIVKMDEFSETVGKSGLVVPDSARNSGPPPLSGRVLAVPADCPDVLDLVNVRVSWEPGKDYGVQEGKEIFGVIKPNDVLLVFEVDGAAPSVA